MQARSVATQFFECTSITQYSSSWKPFRTRIDPVVYAPLATVWRPRSLRTFSLRKVPAEAIVSLLREIAGRSREGRSNIPSAGAIHGLRFVALCSETGTVLMPNAIRTSNNVAVDPEAVRSAILNQLQGSFWVVLIAAKVDSYVSEYGARGGRYALLEAGHCAQELLHLLRTTGIHACPIGAFNDVQCNDLVMFDADASARVVYALALGFEGVGLMP